MFTSRKRKAATYQVAIAIAQAELHRHQGETPITVEQMDRDSFLGIDIPSVYRHSRAPVASEIIKSGFGAEGVEGAGEGGADLTGWVLDGRGF